MNTPSAPPSGADAAAPVASPCINICQMHAGSGWCAGCLRTLDEIAGWSRLDDTARRAVCAQLDRRRTVWRQMQAAGEAPQVLVPHRPLLR